MEKKLNIGLGYGKDRFDKEYKKPTHIYMTGRSNGKTIKSLDRMIDEICNHNDVVDDFYWAQYSLYNSMMQPHISSTITKVIFNDPATIVFWGDGTKTVVKCDKDEKFDPEKGLAMAISKKFLGNKGNYYNTFKEWLPEITLETTTIVNTAPTEIKVGAIAMPSIDDMMKDLNTSINDSIKNIRIG